MSQEAAPSDSGEWTVVDAYVPADRRGDSHQSEAELERDFIDLLEAQGYGRPAIRREADLVANLRARIEELNGIAFTDGEWKRFFGGEIANQNEGILEKTRRIQGDGRIAFRREDGSTRNIALIDRDRLERNSLQVVNQYEEEGGAHACRYDVTILVNGLPLVHVELKRRGVALKEAFNQIRRYQRDSFWAGSGLYEYVQIFVISNGTHTRYYSNTTRDAHVRERVPDGRGRSRKASKTFEFSSRWADAGNRAIDDLADFARTFLRPRVLLNILTRFCVLTTEDQLLVMRPYQICATEAILRRIAESAAAGAAGTTEAGGYVWHTTGSGKTLTSFKTAQLASRMPQVDKVLFVVDRKDLDYQTMREYDRFQKGAANGNTSTKILQKQLEDAGAGIIVTTIQKLGNFVRRNARHAVYGRRVALIFDECHRSQFGELHAAITGAFENYHLFGFTGTPIFAANAGGGSGRAVRTTEQAFGRRLHAYTIVNAIADGNVLPFRVDYVGTVRAKDDVRDARVRAIDTEAALLAPERIGKVADHVLEHFDRKTMRGTSYVVGGRRVSGFNAIFAAASIPAARAYYAALKERVRRRTEAGGGDLALAVIYSFAPNEEDPEDGILQVDESMDAEHLDGSSRDFLDAAIRDYNARFGTSYDTSAEKFENYYKDVSMRMKSGELDLLVVVNMFLTGFDAPRLNTLWADRNLRMHGLIQAFSRTNRILNSVKAFGSIVCFRDLQKETDEAVALFGDENAGGVVLLRSFSDYYDGHDEEKDGKRRHVRGYAELVGELLERFPLGTPIGGEQAEKDFVALFGAILRMRNILSSFDEFEGREILTPAQAQDYQGTYLDMRDRLRPPAADREDIRDDIVFEMELIRQVDVGIDYILELVARYRDSHRGDRTIRAAIERAAGASPELRSRRDLIMDFVDRVGAAGDVTAEWRRYVAGRCEEDLQRLIEEEQLKADKARQFLGRSLEEGELRTIGQDIQEILPPSSPFDRESRRRKLGIIGRIREFFERYVGLTDRAA